VRALSWLAMACAISSFPPFFRYSVMLAPMYFWIAPGLPETSVLESVVFTEVVTVDVDSWCAEDVSRARCQLKAPTAVEGGHSGIPGKVAAQPIAFHGIERKVGSHRMRTCPG